MRFPEIITREIQNLDKIILSSIELLNQFPTDDILRLNVEQSEFRKSELLIELEKSLEYYGQHSLKYIFQDIQDKIKLETLIDGLNSFKGLIDKTFEKVTNGKQNHLPVYFNTVFSGSYGIQLSTPFEEKILDHDFEKAIGETIEIVSDLISSSEDKIKETLQKDFGHNRTLLNKYSLFFKKIYQSNEPVRIEWKSPISNSKKEIIIEPEKAKFLHSYFSQNDKTEETIELIGILKGLSLLRFRVEFLKDVKGKEVITAQFDEKLSEEVKDSLDKYVIAQFSVKIKYNELKDQEERKYELISIKPQG
ncbi:hypothetical protein I2486_15785 [Cellulophaga sp. E16_2]|uniref:hypothetical protein n=1 Tax=Cellulophaga sp. E16_2 TaxID=2789297 RepID=UPI001A926D53|nr:hypothetical protein [Cellulophaga sp. E16_2]MBO0592866.1 hypothetical protein [Cellulophaga sp. E16_2]